MFIRVQEVAVEQWIACHMPRGPYLVNYLEKGGGARSARSGKFGRVWCGLYRHRCVRKRIRWVRVIEADLIVSPGGDNPLICATWW